VVEEWDAATLDQYYNSSSLLCHFDSLNAAGRFIDNSRNNFAITSSGDVSLSTSQYKFGGASAYFDGTGDYLVTPTTSVLTFGTNDLTVELWIYQTVSSVGAYKVIVGDNVYSSVGGWTLYSYNNQLNLWKGGTELIAPSGTLTLNSWNYVVWTRQSGNNRIFINGTQVGSTVSDSTNYTSTAIYVGSSKINTLNFAGYMDELRVTKGVARYTSNFTPPNAPFPNSRNQVLTKYVGLVGGIDDKYVDYGVQKLSDSSLKLTRLTYPNQPIVGSGSLSGSVNRVYVNVLDYTKVSVTSSYSLLSLTASYALNGGSGGGSTLRTGSTYPITSSFSRRAITASYALNGGTALVNQTMKYVSGSNLYVLSRSIVSPSDVLMSVNGVIQTPITDYTVSASSVTFTESYPSGSKINARYLVAATNSSDVNLANIVLTGTTTGDAYYPQVAALLHFDGTNGSTTITDNSKNNLTVTATNGAVISTAQSKFGGSSVFFDGTNDYVSIPNNTEFNFASGTFTVEFWVYFSSVTGERFLVSTYQNSTNGWFVDLYLGKIVVGFTGDGLDITGTTTISTNTWYHIAVSGTPGSYKLFVNGIQEGSTYTGATALSSTSALYLGVLVVSGTGYVYFNGYIDELRITNGYARYTGNFTPSTTAFSNTGGDVGKALVVNSTATGVSIGTAGYFSSQLAKAWVNFNGTGTVAIRDSYNVSSITDSGTGDYTINFSTALNNSNYSAVGSSRAVFGTRISVIGFSNYATTSVRIGTVNLTNQLQDEDTNCVTIFSN
jgi:hypothetical protein